MNLLITGFLGSGKTTFILNSLVKRYRDRRLAIVVNDFGQVSYDRLRFYAEGLRVEGVEGACFCCSALGELLEVLHTLKGADVLLVETSGLSDPYPVMQAMESEGFPPTSIVCVASALQLEEFLKEPLFLAQLELSDCVVLSFCDLLPSYKPYLNLLDGHITFPAYEGSVDEDFYLFVDGVKSKKRRQKRRKAKVNHPFSQITLKLEGFYSMWEMENYLRSLPASIVRVKGYLECIESPLPLGLNWTRKHLSWETVEKPIDSFLTFIGYGDFILPSLPKREISFESMIPLGSYDKRQGIAYLKGMPVDELTAAEKLLKEDLKDAVLLTHEGAFECSLDVGKKLKIELRFCHLHRSLDELKDVKKVLLWDLPDAYASYVVKKLKDKAQVFHVGRQFTLPDAELSLKVDTKEKARVLTR